MLDAGATITDLKRVAVLIVALVAPALLDPDNPEIPEAQAEQAEAVIECLLQGDFGHAIDQRDCN